MSDVGVDTERSRRDVASRMLMVVWRGAGGYREAGMSEAGFPPGPWDEG